MKKRLLCLLLAAVMVLWLMPHIPRASAAAIRKDTTRAIGIVFDNSGSMYGDKNSSWCRATYAMEVFASMMNDGDQLQIYPMWDITLGANSGTAVPVPLVINGPGEANVIRKIFTPYTGGTPFSTVTDAYNGLKNTKADEKYLIILTDGEFNNMGIGTVSAYLDEYCQDVNVMFLAIGKSTRIPQVSNPQRQYYDRAQDSSDVIARLAVMGNRIFGRNMLDISGSNISFDVSMSKLIVFVQGENVSDVKLSGGTLVSGHEMKYSEEGRGDGAAAVDRSLQGMIVTYKDLDAGNYTLSYTGSGTCNVTVYYEPDVDLQVRLVNADGGAVDPSGKIYADNYRLEYCMVDKYGNPTQSKLLGDVQYEIQYTLNGETHTYPDTKAGSIDMPLKAGDNLSGVFTVRYLEDYTCRVSSEAMGWPVGGLNILRPGLDALTMEVTGGRDVYLLSSLEQEAVYQVSVTGMGKIITEGELVVNVRDGNAVPEILKTDTGYTVTLRYPGNAGDTLCGPQQLQFSLIYDGEQSGILHAQDFTIEDDSHGLKVEMEMDQSYYVIPTIEDASPIIFRLTCDGAPLTPEAFAKTTARIEADMGYELEADSANSCYVMRLTQEGTEPGTYKIRCVIDGVDTAGRPCSVEADGSVECQNYPLWLRILVITLLVLLLLALIWAYLNTKVLPKKIGAGTASFVVNGKVVPGKIEVKYTGGGKKRGTLVINSPKYAADPAMKCGMRLELVADSPRRVRSAQRKVRVVAAVPNSKTNTTKMQIGGTTLVKNPTGQFVRMGTQDTKVECTVGNNTRLGVTALILSPVKGKKVTVSLNNLPLKFY